VADVGIRIEGLPRLSEIMRRVGTLQPVKTGLRAGARHLQGKMISEKPPVSRRPVAQFWSDKQRRGFFYYLNAGKIDVPYYRRISQNSEDLTHSWTTEERNGGLTQIVGNDTKYGPLVQDEAMQSRYHKITGWKTIQTISKEQTDEVVRALKEVVDAALEGK